MERRLHARRDERAVRAFTERRRGEGPAIRKPRARLERHLAESATPRKPPPVPARTQTRSLNRLPHTPSPCRPAGQGQTRRQKMLTAVVWRPWLHLKSHDRTRQSHISVV